MTTLVDDGPLDDGWGLCPACRATYVRQDRSRWGHRRTLRGLPVCAECEDEMMDAQQLAEDEMTQQQQEKNT